MATHCGLRTDGSDDSKAATQLARSDAGCQARMVELGFEPLLSSGDSQGALIVGSASQRPAARKRAGARHAGPGPGGRQPAARGDQDTAAGRRGDPKDPMLRLSLAKLLVRQGDKYAAREEHDALATLGADFRGQAEVAALLKSF